MTKVYDVRSLNIGLQKEVMYGKGDLFKQG